MSKLKLSLGIPSNGLMTALGSDVNAINVVILKAIKLANAKAKIKIPFLIPFSPRHHI